MIFIAVVGRQMTTETLQITIKKIILTICLPVKVGNKKKKNKINSILIEARTFRTQKLLINTISNLKHNALTAMKYLQIIPLADHLN